MDTYTRTQINKQLTTGGGKDPEGNIHALGYIYLGSSIALAVWGMSMWLGMRNECQLSYEETHSMLMTLFRACVVLLVIQAIFIVCVALFGAVAVGWMMTTWGRAQEAGRTLVSEAGYQNLGGAEDPRSV
jgi:hypothetical protein